MKKKIQNKNNNKKKKVLSYVVVNMKIQQCGCLVCLLHGVVPIGLKSILSKENTPNSKTTSSP